MLKIILNIILIFFGIVTGLLLALPLMVSMFDSKDHYLPVGIGVIIGVIGAFLLAYAVTFIE